MLGVKYLNGSEFCNCIPGIASPLLVMAAIDLAIFTGIVASWYIASDLKPSVIRSIRGVFVALGAISLFLYPFMACSRNKHKWADHLAHHRL